MNKKNHPITEMYTVASGHNGLARDLIIRRKTVGDKRASITIESENGDCNLVPNLTITDARDIIKGLREVFDIPNEERQMIELLQNQLDASQELIENLSAVTVANIMYENGLRTAVLTPSRIVSGLTPALEIDATRPDQVKYILKEEPLNAQDTTDNGRFDS